MTRATPEHRQPDLFATNVQPLFEAHRAHWLATARAVARQIAYTTGSVCADDIHEHCPPRAGDDPRVMGAVFRTADFIACGYRNSRRAECHHRPIREFRLARQVAA